MEVTSSFTWSPSVLKGAELSLRSADPEDHVLGYPLFFADSLHINVLGDAAIGMTEQLLRRLDVDSFLAQHRRQSMQE